MSRETLKDFLSQRGSSNDSISYTLEKESGDIDKDPGTGEDLLALHDETKGLLGDYVNFIIDSSTNEYKIKPGNEKAASSNRKDNLTLADDQGAEKVFLRQGTILKTEFDKNSNSNRFNESGTDLSSLID